MRQQDLFKSSYVYSVWETTTDARGHEACSETRLRQTSIPGVRRGCPSSPVTCTRLTVPTLLPASHILWLGQLCSGLPPASQKQSHVAHTPQPPESQWVRKDLVGEVYGGKWGLHKTDQVPWIRVQGAWGPSGQAISDGVFLLGFCVSLRIWAAVGESSPSLLSVLSRAGLCSIISQLRSIDTQSWSRNNVSCLQLSFFTRHTLPASFHHLFSRMVGLLNTSTGKDQKLPLPHQCSGGSQSQGQAGGQPSRKNSPPLVGWGRLLAHPFCLFSPRFHYKYLPITHGCTHHRR